MIALAGGTVLGTARPSDQATVRYNRDVRPILADRCFPCHGPDAGSRKAGLRLDRPDGPDGSHGAGEGFAALRPGSREESEVWYRVNVDDEAELMPPPGGHGERLDADELEILGRWIDGGAEYEAFWAFVPPRRSAVHQVASDTWSAGPIDRLVLSRLEAEGMSPSPRADRRTLIRRLSLDLTGLPPTREEVHAFLEDDSAEAYERLVERLLARPAYGEHMARFWLDLVRFADTNGLHHDHFRDQSPYRDWVIRAWNDNLPYDQFLTDQLAGDLLPEATEDQRIASGFHRLHLIIDAGTMLPEESFARNVNDRVTAFGTAFLGLTLQCASCHDHKYDPIRQQEFYELSAFFNNLDAAPETGGRSGPDFLRGVQPPYITFPSARQSARLAELSGEEESLQEKIAFLESEEGAATTAPSASMLERHREELRQLVSRRDELRTTIPAAMVMRERGEVRPAHLLVRGAYDQPGELVERGTPAFLPPLLGVEEIAGTPTRLDLARWLVRADHPLTARVAVNRFWQQLFGVGLVKTSEDFGAQGEWPSHIELLDHLAVEFVESGWDVKALVRRIVCSETYRQSSRGEPAAFAADPENRLLARGSRYRMDAEVIRDQILATSGLLEPEMYGPSVKPPQPPGIWTAVTLPDSYPRTFVADEGTAIHRRSLYTFWKRGMPPPQLALLNAPTRESCTARRERTNTPLQALLLLNEKEYLKAARHLAVTGLERGGGSQQARLEFLYETITGRVPGPAVRDELLRLVEDLQALYGADPSLAQELCVGLEPAEGRAATEIAAWTLVVSTIYNLDGTRTRD